MSFLRYFGYLCYALVVACLLLANKPVFYGRWGWELSLLVILLLGLLARPFIAWLKLITAAPSLKLPSGKVIQLRTSHRLVFAIGGLCVFVLPFELALRINRHIEKKNLTAFHPFLQNRPVPGDREWHINSHGLRGEEISRDKPNGVLRILVVGGSTVFCERVPFEKSHVRCLENLLRERYPERSIEVINAGVPWYTSQHSLINYLFKLRDFSPDVVILWHGINDLYRSFSPYKMAYGAYQSDYSHYVGAVSRIVFGYFRGAPSRGPSTGIEIVDRLGAVAMGRFGGRSGVETTVSRFASLAAFRRNMTCIAERMRVDGVKLVLCTQPNIYAADMGVAERELCVFARTFCLADGTYPDLPSMRRGMQQFNGVTQNVAAEFGVPLVDLAAAVPKDGQHFIDDCHYTEAGNRQVAKSLFAFLVESDLLKL